MFHLPFTLMILLLEAEIISEVAQVAEHPFVAVMMVSFVAIVIAAAHEVAFDAMQQHFSSDDGSRAAQCAHHHIAALSLSLTAEEATEHTALLVLHGHIGRRRNNTGEAGATTGAIGRADRRHRHADGAAQYHWLLAHHRSRRILLPVGIGLLPIWLLPIGIGLPIGLLGLAIRLLGLAIGLLGLPVRLLGLLVL